jgi:hypothetical protein
MTSNLMGQELPSKPNGKRICVKLLVGDVGFEPTTR